MTEPGPAAESAVGIETFATAGLGLARQERMGERLGADVPAGLLAWLAPRALIVGRLDTRLPRFELACETLGAEGWPVVVRRSGGSACPVSRGTLQVALCRRVAPGRGIDWHYRELAGLIATGLAGLGVAVETGEHPDAFCPGRYDLGVGQGKLAGLSQHWRPAGGAMIATTAAALIVEAEPDELCGVVNRFYALAGGTRRCRAPAITSLRRAMPRDGFAGGALIAELGARLADAL